MSAFRKLLVGFTAGYIIGILYAPQKGSKTREKLADAGRSMKDGWNTLADRVTDTIDGVRNSMENVADDAHSLYEQNSFAVDNPDVTTMKGEY